MRYEGYSLLMAVALMAVLPLQNTTAEEAPTPWQIKKCKIYREAWKDLPKLMDTTAFTQGFNDLNEAFIASKCLGNTKICPTNEAKIKAANLLTIASMNGGTASSFPPFRC